MRCLPLLACVLLAGCGTARFADLRSDFPRLQDMRAQCRSAKAQW